MPWDSEAGRGPGAQPVGGGAEPRPFLEVLGARKTYGGIRALDGVDFALHSGQVQCLAGGNGSGKSTLIKVIAGVETPDPGTLLRIDGEPRKGWSPAAAIREGIEVIYQDLSLFPNLSVAENIALGRWVRERRRWVGRAETHRVAAGALSRMGLSLDLRARVGELPLAQQQLVAVARALTADPRWLILDEPTTALTRREIDALFTVVRGLVGEGIAVLFVSHKLDEVLEIASVVTVLRDGRKLGDYPARELDADRLAALITGAALERRRPAQPSPRGEAVLRVDGLSRRSQFHNVTFELRQGEVVGLTGLLGSGRTELAMALFGLNPPDAGLITVAGRPARIRSVPEAIALGIAYVPEDRSLQGLVMDHSVGWNWTLPWLRRLCGRAGSLDLRREAESVQTGLQRFGLDMARALQPVRTLSGGNQQRVLLGKWLAAEPRILILDGPTVGIDVGAKRDIHGMIREQATAGTAVLVISDELDEVLAVTDRFYVMRGGTLTGQYASEATSPEAIRAVLEGDR